MTIFPHCLSMKVLVCACFSGMIIKSTLSHCKKVPQVEKYIIWTLVIILAYSLSFCILCKIDKISFLFSGIFPLVHLPHAIIGWMGKISMCIWGNRVCRKQYKRIMKNSFGIKCQLSKSIFKDEMFEFLYL